MFILSQSCSQSPRYPSGTGNNALEDKAFRHDRILGLLVLLRMCSTLKNISYRPKTAFLFKRKTNLVVDNKCGSFFVDNLFFLVYEKVVDNYAKNLVISRCCFEEARAELHLQLLFWPQRSQRSQLQVSIWSQRSQEWFPCKNCTIARIAIAEIEMFLSLRNRKPDRKDRNDRNVLWFPYDRKDTRRTLFSAIAVFIWKAVVQ